MLSRKRLLRAHHSPVDVYVRSDLLNVAILQRQCLGQLLDALAGNRAGGSGATDEFRRDEDVDLVDRPGV